MKNLGPDASRNLLILSFVAGSADAAGYMGLGRVFTSNMTGNLVLMGIALSQHQFHTSLRTLYVLIMFTLGAGLGAALTSGLPDTAWRSFTVRVIWIEFVLLALFAAGWALLPDSSPSQHLLLASLALAMGFQSATLNRLKVAGVTNTAVTGTLTTLLIGMESLLFGGGSRRETESSRHRVLLQGGVLLLYGAGAFLNGFLMLKERWAIGLAPTLCLLLLLVVHRRTPHQ